MIKLENVEKVYKSGSVETWGLRQVNLEIKKGEFLSIMGPSGAGKSTMINILGGMDKVTKGKYFFEGEEISTYSYNRLCEFRKKQVGFVFQNFALIKRFTVLENIELPLCAKSLQKKARVRFVQDIAEKLKIQDLLYKYPGELSGGQQQRVAIARAVVGDNNLILADEPTGALDIENGENIFELFREINKEGRTVVIVTHNRKIAERTNRIVFLQDGQIIG